MSVLDQIYAARREALQTQRARVLLEELKAQLADAPPPRDFRRAMRADDELSVIAEIKFRSPSAGELRQQRDVEQIARSYQAAGAAALSVLTEPDWFDGRLEYLQRAKSACSLPVLRKDFLFDLYQIFESRCAGADAVLLIAAMLDATVISELVDISDSLGLSVLLEIHDERDLEKCNNLHSVIWGVNHRDLRTLTIDLEVSEKLFPLLPPKSIKIAESGIESRKHLTMMSDRGAAGVLIGSSLMKTEHPGKALAELLRP